MSAVGDAPQSLAQRLHADFDRAVLIDTQDLPWQDSPVPGVQRRMLDRLGDEVARATSLVRYARASAFTAHTHGGGEELWVLDGVFEDEHGRYGPGTYVRNPPGSRHSPRSPQGCVLFVKLWQCDPAERQRLVTDTQQGQPQPLPDRPGVQALPLFADGREQVQIEHWAPGCIQTLHDAGGVELLVLAGTLQVPTSASGTPAATTSLRAWGWWRLPAQTPAQAQAGPQGVRLWVKRGHLPWACAPSSGA